MRNHSFKINQNLGKKFWMHCRTRGTMARPASGHSCRPTSLQWRTRGTAIESSLPVVSATTCNSAGCWAWPGSLSTWCDDRRAHCPRPAQLLRFLKSGICACVKISASVGAFLVTTIHFRSIVEPGQHSDFLCWCNQQRHGRLRGLSVLW